MRGKSLMVVGAIVGALFASTPQGQKVVEQVRQGARDLWRRQDVQSTVSGLQDTVRAKVPVVGDTLADAVDKVKPASRPAE